MRLTHRLIAIAALVIGLVACGKEPSTTRADSLEPNSAPASTVADRVASEPDTPRLKSDKGKPEHSKIRPEPRITIPAGTIFRVALIDAVSSDKSQAGDQFLATLTEPIVVDGKTVFSKGTMVRGRVIDATESGRVKGLASLELTLTQIFRTEGKTISIATKPYTVVAESTKKRDAEVIGGAAGVGAAIGAIAGGGKGAAIGATVGGGAGTGTVLGTKGKEIRYRPEHRLSFTLAGSIAI